MKISVTLTQQKFQELLLNIYLKGQTSENINLIELIEEIKQQVVSEKR
ncbi:hypothetical protein J7E79_18910 [Bacillus sp. ISL-40]|nr:MULTISPECIES: hypothetical protein [unclassified Bacillus (in: firmicutes)]MBT2699459.1 hypothetical protein [Bacillus sp. ISL-40]MBT2721989.1 hypothetical protein [Bacillus sp. ISL-46]MBT2741662.1 hypothetical protein [Bacillus sp. ISL-77]